MRWSLELYTYLGGTGGSKAGLIANVPTFAHGCIYDATMVWLRARWTSVPFVSLHSCRDGPSFYSDIEDADYRVFPDHCAYASTKKNDSSVLIISASWVSATVGLRRAASSLMTCSESTRFRALGRKGLAEDMDHDCSAKP